VRTAFSWRGILKSLRIALVWMCGLLAIGVGAMAIRSLWQTNEIGYYTWQSKLGTRGVDHRIIIGSHRGSLFFLTMTADIPSEILVDWYGGPRNEVIVRGGAELCLAAAALARGNGLVSRPQPRWLFGGFRMGSDRNDAPGDSWQIETVVMPYWAPFLLLVLAPLARLRKQRTLRRRRQNGLCLYCGYDLRASGPVCSECGGLRADLKVMATKTPPQSELATHWPVVVTCSSLVAAGLALVALATWQTHRPEPAVRVQATSQLPQDPLPRMVELELAPGMSAYFALIPAGRFTMGSPPGEAPWPYNGNEAPSLGDERGEHEVTIGKSFYMGVTTVTQDQYEAVTGKNPSHCKGSTSPVETISWYDAVDFCAKVCKRTGCRVRLPTEAEWEYACRAGTSTPFNTGRWLPRDAANYDQHGTYPSNRAGGPDATPLPVASFSPNAWGLYDMHGGVLQWCSDWYAPYPTGPASDPAGPAGGQEHVLRGGCWRNCALICRSACRTRSHAGYYCYEHGLRLAMDAH